MSVSVDRAIPQNRVWMRYLLENNSSQAVGHKDDRALVLLVIDTDQHEYFVIFYLAEKNIRRETGEHF